MTRNEIINEISKQVSIKLESLYTIFECNSKSRQKRFSHVINDMINKGMIVYNKETDIISLPLPRQRKKKKKKEVKKEKKMELKKKLMDATTDFDSIVSKYKIRKDFPASVMREAENVETTIPEKEIKKRLDLRNFLIFTIDGEDAKDLDDAVSIEKLQDGWKLGVHIADVSYYVPKQSKLDIEALKRGNSFYFVNKVVPMFPKNLSNGICSLNPQEDRLTLSIFMHIDKNGEVKKYNIYKSIINSKYRLTYEKVQNYLDGKENFPSSELEDSLNEMNVLFRILHKKRMKEGGIDFDFKEQKCILDENDEPIKFYLKERLDSERIIEEFMLIANQTIAKFLSEKGISIYRIHGEPPVEKIQDFVRLTLKLGHKIYGVPVPDAKELQRILYEVKDKPYKELINQLLLRSMQQAKYDTNNIGHYGLGFEFYTHFTSPIRRYADLIVHRLIKNNLFDKSKKSLYSEQELSRISQHISTMERVAMEAERDFYKIKSLRFMLGREGKKYEGLITGVSSFGIFVEIKKYGIEGLVRYQDIEDDYYIFNEKDHVAFGKKTKKRYTLGDRVFVKVKRVNLHKGYLDLLIINNERI